MSAGSRCGTSPVRAAGGASSDGSVGWAEPTPALFSASSDAGLDLRPLVGPCGIPARMLTDPVLAPIEAELTRVACEASEGRTPLEVSIDRPNDDLVRAIFDPIDTELARRGDQEPAPLALPPLFGDLPSIHLRVMQCVTVVETVTHPEREVSRDAVAAELDDVEAGDELLFAVAFTPAMRACLAGDEGRYGFLPSPRWQPGLARPLWAALRSMLQAVAAEARRSGS